MLRTEYCLARAERHEGSPPTDQSLEVYARITSARTLFPSYVNGAIALGKMRKPGDQSKLKWWAGGKPNAISVEFFITVLLLLGKSAGLCERTVGLRAGLWV